MTQIINGIYKTNELSANSNGGTEQMAKRMVRDIKPELLEGFQIIHSRVRELDPNLKKILVCHDLHSDPEIANLTDPEYRKQFEKIVFVSHWQQQMYNLALGVPYAESCVIQNGIEAIGPVDKDYSGTINLIYHTTPHRGLNILYPVFEHLAEREDIHLDVFSSFGVYGWGDRDAEYADLFEKLDNHPRITNHGAQPNEVVREKLKETHIFAYPSIWPETSCIAAIEAMYANNFVVTPNLAALTETVGKETVYQFHEDMNVHANIFYQNLKMIVDKIRSNPDIANLVADNKRSQVHSYYNWETSVLPRWEGLLTSLR